MLGNEMTIRALKKPQHIVENLKRYADVPDCVPSPRHAQKRAGKGLCTHSD